MSVSSTASRSSVVLPWVRTVVRVGLGVVWIVAGATKIGDPAQSVAAVRAYELLPDTLAQLLGWALPYLEILLGLVLISGLFTRWSAALSGLLQLAFVIGLIQAWARGLNIDCGCFSAGGQVAEGQTTYGLDLARDLVFLAAAVWLFLQPVTRLSLDAVTGGFDQPHQLDRA
ncbi:DoxX family protein [Microlunatus soli]|uniref:Methylamine utilisation protein MauE n=1 Tax=Microlunatus soli TaxID=630515 RepID=A0A1H2A3N6_9ACTN|nr:MauE/DoxX family redox-associated membrane protein [Microlunatus soli]SDT40591.1 Methylamine utilisation protein MauE [Microlunatus soli]